MEVTQEMLEAAVKKAVELKLIPAWGSTENYLNNWDKIKQILEASQSLDGKKE